MNIIKTNEILFVIKEIINLATIQIETKSHEFIDYTIESSGCSPF